VNPKRARNLLLSGPPGCGKSTLIEKVVRHIDTRVTGFFTREIRENQRRVGFEIITIHGDQGVLAHVNLKSRVRVGRYGVSLEDLERIAVPAMIPTKPDEIVIIDEIGKMECFSPLFRETLERTLDSAHHVIGSIAKKGDRFIERIKNRADVTLITVTAHNRDALVSRVLETIA
jgi:nucleoside-triphosphatase THEP1